MSNRQNRSKFELEALEPRVLLSADALLASAALAGAAHHHTETVHEVSVSGHGTFQDAVGYNPGSSATGMFEGVAGEAISSHAVSTPGVQSHPAETSTATHTNPVQNSDTTTTSKAEVKTVSSSVATNVTPVPTASNASISASANSTSANTMTQQLTTSLTSANGPPANANASQTPVNTQVSSSSSTSTSSGNASSSSANTANPSNPHPADSSSSVDLSSTISAELTLYQNGTVSGSVTKDLGSVSLGGVLNLNTVQLIFNFSNVGGTWTGTVSVTAASASLNLGGAVTSTIGTVTGSYDLTSHKYALTLNQVKIAFSSFVNVSADTASLTYVDSSNTTATLTNGTSTTQKSVSVLTVGINNATIFAGINGPDTNAGAEGVKLTGANLALALMSAADGTTYYGLHATASSISAVGLPDGIKISATNLSVDVNSSNDVTGGVTNVVDFTATFGSSGLSVSTGGNSVALNFTQQILQASGVIELSLNNFVYVNSSVAITSQTVNGVNLTDGTTVSNVAMLTIGASDVTIFAGVGATTNTDGTLNTDDATGVQLTNASFGLALLSVNGKSYYGVDAKADSLAGVNLPGGIKISATAVEVQINSSNDGSNVVNFDTSFTAGTGLTVETGPTSSINLDSTAEYLRVVGTVLINLDNFVYVSGSVAITSQTVDGVNITGSTTAVDGVGMLTIGASDVTIFAGVGATTNTDGTLNTDDATGVKLTNASFGLALLGVNGKSYYGVDAKADSLAGVNLPGGIKISATAVEVQINSSNDGSNVVNFDTSFTAGTGLTVETGPTSSINLDFTSQYLQVVGTVLIDLNSFVYVSGSVAITSQTVDGVNITGSTTAVDGVGMLTIGASDVTIFAGVGATTNTDGTLNTDDATGVQLTNASFGLALLSVNGKSYYGVDAKADSLAGVNLPGGIKISATAVEVQINSSNDGSNVVNFDSSFTSTTSANHKGLDVLTGPTSSINLDFTGEYLRVVGTVLINLDSFVYVSGSVAITSQTVDGINITGSTTAVDGVNILTIGASDVTIFAGVGATTTDGVLNTDDATGVQLTNASFGLALLSVNGKSYYGVDAKADSLAGVNLPGGIQISATAVEVQINSSNDGSNVVNFDTSFTAGTGLTVETGPSSSINLDFTAEYLRVVGTVLINLDSFVYVSGSVAITSQTVDGINITGSTAAVDGVGMLTIGASDVTIFAGVGATTTDGVLNTDDATGVKLTNASFGLALLSVNGKSYYGVDAKADSLAGVNLPGGIQISATAVEVQINSSNDGSNVVNFDTSFTAGTGLTVETGPSSSINLDFTGEYLQVVGTILLNFNQFIYVSGSLDITKGTTATVNLSDSTTTTVSMLTVGASAVTIFAGMGATLNTDGSLNTSAAVGIRLSNANFALALLNGSNGKTYYGLYATADSIGGVGLPGSITISATDLQVEINSSNDVAGGVTNVVNFDTSFTSGTSTNGKGLDVGTGPTTSQNLDFTGSLILVQGSLTLAMGDFISLSGGFNYTQTADEIDIKVGHLAFAGASDLAFTVGPTASPYFSATGYLSLVLTADALTINTASLTVADLKIASLLDVKLLTLTISDISIDLSTGAMGGVTDDTGVHDPILTVTAASATLFPGNSSITGGVSATTGTDADGLGFQSTFNLSTGKFSIVLEQFHLAVGTVFTADATNVLVTYDPASTDPHQQLVQIGSGTLNFKFGSSDITGSLTNLIIYADGFHFASVTITYNGSINLGSILTIVNPSVTLTNFGVTFGGSNTTITETGSLTLSVSSATLNVGSLFSASATNLSITVALDPANMGDFTITAASLNLVFGGVVSMSATNISINTNPLDSADSANAAAIAANPNADAYFSVTSATATLALGSALSAYGTATNFSVIKSGSAVKLREDTGFSVLISVTPGQLNLPTWLGFQIQKFQIKWNDFVNRPDLFQLTLSASITSISGLPGGVTVSGEITDAVIDTGKLEAGEFPIVSIGSVGGSVSGTLFGMEVNASFVLGLVSFNAENQIVNADGTVTKLVTDTHGNVTESTVTSNPDKVITNTIMYVGVAGGASIPGLGGVQIYLGFSSLGPLTLYLSAQFPLILDPNTGLAIGGFSGGVIFNYQIPTPGKPQDLATTVISPQNITISQWQNQLRDQTVSQYTASGGGTDLSAAYSQPFVIEAGVTLYDAYLSQDAFTITGNIAIQINPSNANSVKIFVTGTATFGASVSFNAYLFADIEVSGGTSTVTLMFLVQAPAATPVETIGGALLFGFTDSAGNAITPAAAAAQIYSEWIALGTNYDSTGAATVSNLAAGSYVWTPGTNDTSLTIGGTTYLASSAVNGQVNITTTTVSNAVFVGTANTAITGTLGSLGTVTGAQYTISVLPQQAAVGGFYVSIDGFAQFSAFGTLTATISGSVTLTVTGTFAKIDLSGDLNISSLGDLATAAGEIVVDYSGGLSSLQIYGVLQLQTGSGFAKLEAVGLYANGAATFILNTTDSPQTVKLPDPAHPHDATKATTYNITDTKLFEVTIGGVGSTALNPTYASLDYKAGGTTLVSMQGAFDLKISSTGLTMYADIHELTIGSFLTFSGYGLFVINDQGFAAEMDLALSAQNISGITLTASFTLVMNTTQADVLYTIPSGLPPLTIPGTSTMVTSLTIPRGPPQGQIQADGTYATVGATGPYIVVTGTGELDLEGLTLNGYFYFQMSNSVETGFTLVLAVNVSGNVPSVGQASVTGALQITDNGEVALLAVTASGGNSNTPTDYGAGISFQVTAQLGINTTNADVSEIGGITLSTPIAKNSYSIVASGSLTLSVGGVAGFVINGVFSLTSSQSDAGNADDVTTTTIKLGGTLTATVAGNNLLTMSVQGVLSLSYTTSAGTSSSKAYGALVLTYAGSGSKNPLSGGSYSFINASFLLELNTTGVTQNPVDASNNPLIFNGQTVTLTAGANNSATASNYVQIYAIGTLVFGSYGGSLTDSTTNGFILNTTPTTADPNLGLYLSMSTSGISIGANVKMSVVVFGNALLTANASAGMLISSAGFAASLTITATMSSSTGLYAFDGTFTLQINTTGTQQTIGSGIGSVVIPASAGGSTSSTGSAYFQLKVDGTLVLGSTNTATATGVLLSGHFYLVVSSAGLAVTASATLNLAVSGSNIFSFTANGALLINASGIAAKITLTLGSGGQGGLFGGGVSFLLEVNSTGSAVSTINNVSVNLRSGPFFEVDASGNLNVAGVTINGSFTLTVDSNGVEVTMSASISIFGNLFTVSGAAGFYSDGFALNILLALRGSSSPQVTIISGVLTLSGSFQLQINTTGSAHFGVNSGTIFNVAVNASFNVLGFSMASASFNVGLSGGVFSASGNVNFDFFGFVTLNVAFYFDSSGKYTFTGSIYVQVGSSGFNIHGQLTLVFSNQPGHPNFELDVSGGVTAFGITDIISADVNVTISGGSVDMSVWAGIRLNFGLFHVNIGGTVHIHLGTLNTPTPPPPPPLGNVVGSGGSVTVDGVTYGSGTLALYLGSLVSQRGVPAMTDENYTISQDSSGNILVSAPGISGQTLTYAGVNTIVVPNAGSSNVIIQIDPSVTKTVIIDAGSGTNQFYLGAGTSTVNGTSGNDTVTGGSGNVTFNAGSGASTFIGGGSGSTHNVVNDPGSVTVVEGGYTYYSLVDATPVNGTRTGTLYYGNSTSNASSNYTTLNGSDISLSLTGAASGAQTFSNTNYLGNVTFDANNNNTLTTSIQLDAGTLTVSGNTVTETNGATGTVTLLNSGGTTYGALNLYGSAGVNTFNVNSWSGGALTLDGKGGADTYNVNFQNSGAFTATVTDSGSSGNDLLNINGTNTGTTVNVSGSAVSLGSQIVNYSNIETLVVNTQSANALVAISGTSAATTINTGAFNSNTINIGVLNTGTLNNVLSALTITASGTGNTVNLTDVADATANTGTLTSNTLTGFFGANGSLSYSGIATFNLNLGSGGNTLTVQGGSGTMNINTGTGADTVNVQAMNGIINLNTGSGTNVVNLGSNSPSGNGVVKNIQGKLTVTGNGTTTLNADDTGDTAATGTLTASLLSGLGIGSGGVSYSGLSALNISLGNSGNTFMISNTSAVTTVTGGSGADTINLTTNANPTTINGQGGNDIINVTTNTATTTINGGDGNDTVNILNDGATTSVVSGNGNDTINIQNTGAGTSVTNTSGTDTINIGSKATLLVNGIVNGIQGAVIVTGGGTDILNVDDTGSTTAKTGLLTSTALTGLGLAVGGITYSGLATLNISLGSGGDTINIQSTNSTTITTVNTGAGNNMVNVTSNAPATTGGILTGIAGQLILNGQGTDTVNLNDAADAGADTLTQTATTLKGLGMGANGIQYSSIETLNIKLGAHNNTIYLQGNSAVTTENLNTGSGTNIISVGSQAQSSITTDATTGMGTNTGSVLDNVQGIINITGSGTDTLNVDDSGSTADEGMGMWSNKLQFLNPAAVINFTGISSITLSLSQGADSIAIKDTITNAATTPTIVIDGNGGADTFVIFDTHAVMTINGGDGDDNFYNFGNSSVLYLNGDANDDTFYIYASVSENTSNVDAGAASSNGNQIFSYRQNAAVNIDGGTGNDKVFIFATVLNDVIYINGTHVTGAGVNVSFTNIEQLVVAGLGGDDTFYIQAVAVPTTVIGDGAIVLPNVANLLNALGLTLPNLNGSAPPATSFNDTFYLGWQGASYIPGSLAGFVAPLTIYGDNGPNLDGSTTNTANTVDTIYADDSGDTVSRSFTLTGTTLSGTGFGAGGSIIYDSAVENLNFYTGAGNNTITVTGNNTASQTSLYGGRGNDAFIVNGAIASPLAIIGGTNTFAGDTLTVNGGVAGNTFDITGFSIDGDGATINYQEIEKLTVNANGATTFNLNSDSIPTFLNGGAFNDTFNINSNVVPLTLDGGAGDDTFNINSNSAALTATGDAGNDTFNVNGNSSTLTLSGGDDNDVFVLNANSGTLTANGNNGNDSFTVNAISSPATLNGNAGNDSFTVNTPLAAVLTVNGGGDPGDLLTVNGTTGNDYFVITGTSVTGVGSAINYTATNNLTVNGVASNDTFKILSDSVNTIINGSSGNDLFYVQTTNGTTTINTGGGINTVNIGSNQPYLTGNILDGIQGAVIVNGGPQDTLNINDGASTINKTGTLTATTLNGLGMGVGGISYYGIPTLNLLLGLGNDTLNIQSTNSTTITTVNTNTGTNTVNVGSTEPTLGGIVDNIQGALILIGSGTDILNVDDTGSTAAKTGVLTATTLNGLAMGTSGITYSGFATLSISLGSGGNTFNITTTNATTTTTLNSGSGADTVNLTTDAGVTTINGQDGADTINVATDAAVTNINGGTGNDIINVRTLGATTTVNTGTGTNTVNIGSLAPVLMNGIVDGIQGALIIVGSGTDILNVDDTGSTAAKTGTLTSTTLTGLGMIAAGITYSGLANLNISLGSGGNTFTVSSTNATTVTTLNSGSGADTVTVVTAAGVTNINGQAGNDTINIRATSAVTTVNTGTGTNTVNVGSLAPTLVNGIQGALIVVGSSTDILNVDDTGSTTAKTGTLTSTTLTVLGMVAAGITYSGLATLNISLGSGGNTFTINSTNASTTTTLNSGSGADTVNLLTDVGATNINGQAGNDTINIRATSAVTTVNTGTGTNTVNVGSLAPNVGGVVNNIQGALTVVGSGADTLNVDDTGSATAKIGTLTSTTLTGLSMIAAGITYSGLATLNISLGSGGNTFTISSTNATTVTTLNSGSGADTVNLLTDAGVTNINGQAGNDTINVRTTNGTTTVNTGTGTNTVNVGSLAPTLTNGIVDGIQGALIIIGSGTDTLNVDDTGSTTVKTGTLTSTTLTGLGMIAAGITYSGLATLNISLGSGGNTFTISSTNATTVTTLNSGSGADTVTVVTDAGVTNINGQAGNDTINIRATSAVTTVNTGTGTNTVNVGSLAPAVGGMVDNIQGALIVVGSGSDTMNVDDTGSSAAKTGTLTSTKLTGLAMVAGGITYSGLTTLNISLGSGGNTFTINSTNALTATTLNSGSGNDTVNLLADAGVTNINGQAGNDIVNVRTVNGTTTVNTGAGTNTVNVGSLAPATSGIVNGIQGALIVTGNGSDTMNVDDTGSSTVKTGILTSTTITGLAMGPSGITYSGLAALNISLGSGNDQFNVRSTSTGTVTTLNTGTGTNTVNVNSTGQGVGGILDGIQGALIVVGSGTDTMNVDDTGSTTAKTGMLTSTKLTGLAMVAAGITYSGLATLNISLGSGGNTFTISSTYATTVTTLNSGSGSDTVALLKDSGTTNINGQAGNDVINVISTGATTTVNTGTGTNIVNVGTLAPAVGGIASDIQGALIVVGSGTDTLNVDDTGSTTAKTGTLTSTTLTGLGMIAAGITYSGLANLNISLGSKGNTFTISSTNAATVTTLNSGSGNDTVKLITDAGVTNINSQAGNDIINVLATGAVTTVNTGSGTNTVNVGSVAPTVGGVVNNIQGALSIVGSGSDTLNVDDTGSTAAKNGTLTATTLTGLTMGTNGITYSGLANLNINLGSNNDIFNVQGTYTTTVTTLKTNAGANTVNVGNLSPLVGGILDNIQGALIIIGNANDTLNVDDTGSTAAKTGTLTATTLTGLGLGGNGITYSGLVNLNISLGSGGNTLTIASTAEVTTRIHSGSGNDVFNIQATLGALYLNGDGGNNTFNFGSTAPTIGGTLGNIAGAVFITGGSNPMRLLNLSGSGTNTVNVDDTGDAAANIGVLTSSTLTGLGLGAGITFVSVNTMNINFGPGGDVFSVQSTNATTVTTLKAGGSANVVNVGSLAPTVGGVLDMIQGALIVVGSGGNDILNVDDTASMTAKNGTLTGTTLTGLGMGANGITYSGLATLNLSLGNGGDTLLIAGTATTTTRVRSGGGNDVFNIQATTGTLYLNGDGGNNIFNFGSLAPGVGGTLNNIAGAVFITGGSDPMRLFNLSGPGTNTVNVDDTGDATANIGTLTSSTLTGLGLGAGITFVSVNTMNINLGSGNDTFNVQSTNATTVTTLNTGAGANVVNVGGLAPAVGSVVDNIQGALTVVGGGYDTMNVDDTGSTTAKTGTLTDTTLTGLGLGASGITYSGVANLNISLGSGGNTFTISNTNAATVTTLNSGSGNDWVTLTTDSSFTTINGQDGADTINVLNDNAATTINGGNGNDTINILGINAPTTVNTNGGVNTVNVGSLAPATGGVLDTIQSAIYLTGSGADTLNVDDTGSTIAKTGILSSVSLSGLGMGVSGIAYSGIANLNISLGSGGNTFTINSTNATTLTTVNSGSGNDTVTLKTDAGVTNINTQAGNDTINVLATGAVTTVNTGTGANTVNIGSLAPAVGGVVNTIQGALSIVGSGSDTLNVDDTGSTAAKNGTLTATTLTGLAMGASGITYSGLTTLNLNLGSGSDTFTVTGVTNSTVTTIDGKTGTNTATLNFSGNFAGNLTLLNFVTATLYVGGNFSGTLNDAGAVTPVTIVGSLTSTGVLNAGSINTMTVGVDLAGTVTVTGLLNTLTVTGGTPGKIVAGSINVITVLAGYGNKVLQVIEGGIERDITATPIAGGTMPNTVHFAFVYDSQTTATPQLAIRTTDTNPAPRSFNLALVVANSASAQFNLSRIDSTANGVTGLGNISLQGSVLTQLTAPELALFTNLTASSPGGIWLPSDSIIGVEASGSITQGYINLAGIEGLAFSTFLNPSGNPIVITTPFGSASNIQVLWNLFGSHVTLNAANDAFVAVYNNTQPVRLFAHTNSSPDLNLVTSWSR